MQGTITTINHRGFGFIQSTDSKSDVFFHSTALRGDLVFDTSLRGLRVEFELGEGPKGPLAKNVRKAGDDDAK